MDSTRDAADASDAVISPRPWPTLRESPPGWLCPIGFKLSIGEAFEGPFAKIFDPSKETEKLLVQVSQLDWSQVRQAAWMPRSLTRSTILLPSSWSVHRRNLCNRLLHRKHWWKLRSYCFGSCMHVWCNKPHRCYGLWHNRQFASQQLEHSLEEPVHATGSSDERS